MPHNKTYLSILGDSISTYPGVSNDAKANASTAFYPCFYRASFPLDRTYWKRTMDALGMELCVNNSYSGGNLSGRQDETSGVNRARQLSRDDGTTPDLILLFMGLNDLGRRVPVETFCADYQETLSICKEQYPNAKICCVNLPDRDPVMRAQTVRFNEAISLAVERASADAFVADLFHSPLNNDCYYDNTTDGLHPDEDGMRLIAEVVIDAIRKSL